MENLNAIEEIKKSLQKLQGEISPIKEHIAKCMEHEEEGKCKAHEKKSTH